MNMQVDILLDCGHILSVPIESVLLVPQVGASIRCTQCHTNQKVSKVGTPYRVERINVNNDKSQRSMMGDK